MTKEEKYKKIIELKDKQIEILLKHVGTKDIDNIPGIVKDTLDTIKDAYLLASLQSQIIKIKHQK